MAGGRRDRAKMLARIDGLTKEEFVRKTGFSEDQWYYWFGNGKKAGPPNPDQIETICMAFDWSPTYIFYGIGSMRLSEISNSNPEDELKSQLQSLQNQQAEILARLDNISELLGGAHKTIN